MYDCGFAVKSTMTFAREYVPLKARMMRLSYGAWDSAR